MDYTVEYRLFYGTDLKGYNYGPKTEGRKDVPYRVTQGHLVPDVN